MSTIALDESPPQVFREIMSHLNVPVVNPSPGGWRRDKEAQGNFRERAVDASSYTGIPQEHWRRHKSLVSQTVLVLVLVLVLVPLLLLLLLIVAVAIAIPEPRSTTMQQGDKGDSEV